MYTFLDKSGRKLCLRPEFTSSVVRAVLNNRALDSANRAYYVCFLLSFSLVWKRLSIWEPSARKISRIPSIRRRDYSVQSGERRHGDHLSLPLHSAPSGSPPSKRTFTQFVRKRSRNERLPQSLARTLPSPSSLTNSRTSPNTMIRCRTKARLDLIAAVCFES